MIKLYTVTKEKTGIIGLWKDKGGKVFVDRIKIKEVPFILDLCFEKKKLFRQGEKAVFYSENIYNTATIESKEGSKDILKHCLIWQEKNLKVSMIKYLLNHHGGLTIFKELNGYKIEIWKA